MKPALFILMSIFLFASCNKEQFQVSNISTKNQTNSIVSRVPRHIVICIEENKAYEKIIGSANAPFINQLANTDTLSCLFTKSYSIQHPSQPNYLDLFSGDDQGVTSDSVPIDQPFTTDNLARELMDAGYTYATYSEDLPSVGWNDTANLKYARKHNPAANWMGTGTNQISPTTNQPYTAFPTVNFGSALPTVSIVVPNLDHDMHDGTIRQGDTWLKKNLLKYINWAKKNNGLFILTFDEDDQTHTNHIVTIFTGQYVKYGQNADTINHYSVLRTIEDIYGLRHAANAATATSITDCWK